MPRFTASSRGNNQKDPLPDTTSVKSINVLFYVCSHRGDIKHTKTTTTYFYNIIILAYPLDYEQPTPHLPLRGALTVESLARQFTSK